MILDIKDIKDLFSYRSIDANKYDFGVVGIMGGSTSFSGALKLASMSASSLRSGAGLVRVILEENLKDAIMPYILEQTLHVLNDDLDIALQKLDVLAVGMGWGQDTSRHEYLEYILNNYSKKLILDADALNILAKNLNLLNNTKAQIILTPHLQEFARLLNISAEKIQENCEQYAEYFARKHNVILLLKGHTTIVTDGKITYLVESGSPGMATAGSGDVLSGIIAGYLGYNAYNPLSVAAAAYLAGLAGTLATKKYTDIAAIASDQIEFIPEAIKIIRGEHEKN